MENNIPAFPGKSFTESGYPNGESRGMMLIDYFAAKAMQGIIANNWNELTCSDEVLAKDSYKLAAAMLEARTQYIK